MTWFVQVSVYCLLSYSTVPVAGQCTVSSCADSLAGFEESLQVSLEEHDHRLEKMDQNMCSALENLEAAVNRTNARGQEELRQDLKTLYHNMSVNLEIVSEKISEIPEWQATQEQEKCLSSMNSSLTSIIVRNNEYIQAVNENLSSALQTVNEKFQVIQVQIQSQSNKFQTVNIILDEKLQVMQVQLQSQSSALQTVNRSLEEKFQVMQVQHQSQSSALQNVNRSLEEKLQVMQMQLSSLINDSVDAVLRELQEKFQTLNEALSSAIDKSNEKLKERNQSVEFHDHCRNTSSVCDCSDIEANGYTTSGVYRIYVVDQGQRYYANVSCDMTTTKGGWTVFQRRKDGSVDFYRRWSDYENGFGNPNGEFWLGNNFLHLLTSKRRYRLRIDLEDFEGGKRYAEYSIFDITSPADKYRLRICSHSGNAGDSLSYHNGQRFSTKDNDNDADSGNCAAHCSGAWWYNSCHQSNLNGLYLRGNFSSNRSLSGFEGVRWSGFHSTWYSLKTTEMKISPS